MNLRSRRIVTGGLAAAFVTVVVAQEAKKPSSYSPVVIQEDFGSIMKRMSAAKAGVNKKQQALLEEERYDLRTGRHQA